MDLRASCPDVWPRLDHLHYSPNVGDDTNGEHDGQGGADLPVRRVTPNMLVAYNMARWRRASDLTQEQLGEQLGGWGKTTVSAAERSWDGKRVRQFDAGVIVQLASIFGVPIPALFLPPPEDEETVRYVVDTGHGTVRMSDFFVVYVLAVPGFDSPKNPAFRAYDEVLVASVAKYAGPSFAKVVAARLSQRTTHVRLAKALDRALDSSTALTFIQRAIPGMSSDNYLLQDVLATMMRETEEGRTHLAQQDRSSRQRAWSDLPSEIRHEQAQFIEIGREMFGDRGPVSEAEIDRVTTEGRSRGIYSAPLTRRRLLDGERELIGPEPSQLSATNIDMEAAVEERHGGALGVQRNEGDETGTSGGDRP